MMCKTQNILCRALKAGCKVGISLFFAVQITFALAAQTVTVAWNPTSETDLAGYNLYVGTQSGVYSNRLNVGNITSNTVSGLVRGVRYYFAVTAYNQAGAESDYSAEISYLLPATNTPPTLAAITDRTILEDAGLQTVALSGISSGAASESQTLTVTALSSNPSLVPHPTVNYASPAGTGTLNFTPVANASGTATITVTVNDGQAANNLVARSFTVTVNPVNDAPVLSGFANQTLPINTQSSAIPFTVQDVETPAGNLTLQSASSNPGLISSSQMTFGGSGTNRTLTLKPALNQSGTATITVTLSDGSASVTRQFLLSVTASSLDTWRTQSFSQADLSDPAKEATVWGDKADPDKDGRDNLLEFALGLAPLKKDPAKASLENSVIQLGDGRYATLTFTRRKNEPALQYIPEVSGDGQAWSTGSAAVQEVGVTSVDNVFDKVVVQDLAPILPSAPRYFRLRVVKN